MNKLSPNKIFTNIFLGLVLQVLSIHSVFANSDQERMTQIKIDDVSIDEQSTFDRKFIELKSVDNGIINTKELYNLDAQIEHMKAHLLEFLIQSMIFTLL
ncbi:hypothetical protein H206_05633 [Candidatus Electrothrix aarhusensis]|uniref:Uncharacterized protein n=1 Tax=Candidatus Electrothrix aarhusensis TaxID=1859131 RepID=A0A444J3Z0_9BACT|nr:hypothetical protein H206_05633 [Candidatus Electrothrix aarhusensis]